MDSDVEQSPAGGDLRAAALVEAIAQARRMLALAQATETLLLASAYDLGVEQIGASSSSGDPDRDIPLRSLAAQIGAATRTADRTTGIRMSEAAIVRDRFPATLGALTAGEISATHLRMIAELGGRIDDADARATFENEALAVARRETPGRARAAVSRLAEAHAPRSISERHVEARAGREVRVQDGDDGMSMLSAWLPSSLAHAAFDRLTSVAKAVRDAAPETDHRRLSELRADVLSDLLLTGRATAEVRDGSTAVSASIRAHVQVVIPVDTLLGGEGGGELTGGTVIDPATARALAAAAQGWDRLFVHAGTGAVLAVDRYRPSDQQRRMLAARDEHCRFPGCRVPIARCDVDHTVAAAHGGPTEIRNLAHLCRRHHTLKHHSAWRVRQLPDGTLEWTTPTGRRHDDHPARTLVFTANTEPAPF